MKKQIWSFIFSILWIGSAWSQPVESAKKEWKDTIEKVKSLGVITMGVRESSGSLSYALWDGKFAGYHVELCQHIIANLEKTVGKKLEVKYLPVTSQSRIPLIQNGTIDIECGSTTNNTARQKEVSFAFTTYVEEVRIAVKADSGITSIKQLHGRSVVTTAGTTSVQTLRKNELAKGLDFKELLGKDHAESFALLSEGRADAFVLDSSILASHISKAPKPETFKIVGEVLSVEPIAIMMHKNNPVLKKLADETLKTLMKNGEIARIYNRWFMLPIPPFNTRIGLFPNQSTFAAWGTPNDRPMEDYAQK